MIKIALIGYGKMGHMIQELVKNMPLEIVAIIDPNQSGCEKEIDNTTLKDAEVCIEFSHPDAVIDNIRQVCAYSRNLVVGTTGWSDRLAEVQKMVADAGIGMVYGSNLSIGMNLFYEVVSKAAEVFAKYEDYDVYGMEQHHKQKADSPSGTARELSNIILKEYERKSMAQYEKLDRKIFDVEMHFASVRGGYVPGTHTIGFDSEADTIELTHRVRNRTGLALGAIKAALWIYQKKGLYTFRDYIKDIK